MVCIGIRSASLQFALIATILCGSAWRASSTTGAAHDGWKQAIQSRVALYGHRNWIVIADSAYPSQAAEGIETMVADAGQLEVLDF